MLTQYFIDLLVILSLFHCYIIIFIIFHIIRYLLRRKKIKKLNFYLSNYFHSFSEYKQKKIRRRYWNLFQFFFFSLVWFFLLMPLMKEEKLGTLNFIYEFHKWW